MYASERLKIGLRDGGRDTPPPVVEHSGAGVFICLYERSVYI